MEYFWNCADGMLAQGLAVAEPWRQTVHKISIKMVKKSNRNIMGIAINA